MRKTSDQPQCSRLSRSYFCAFNPLCLSKSQFRAISPSSGGGSPPEILPRHICPTTCIVCGDEATGYHYEVPSCNGCKTFFRRTVMTQRNYVCKQGWNCFETLPRERRCFCRACRFKQCVDVGMNPLAIQTPNDLTENHLVRAIVRKRTAYQQALTSGSDSNKLIPLRMSTVDQEVANLIDGLLYLELKKDTLRKSRYNPNPTTLPSLRDFLKAGNALSLGDRVGPMPNWPLTSRPMPPGPPPPGEPSRPFDPLRKDWFVFDMMVCIEYAKTFPFFYYLSDEDQLILVKSVTMLTFMLTQAFFSYENKSDELYHPDGGSLPSRTMKMQGPDGSVLPPKKDDFNRQWHVKKLSIAPLIRVQVSKKEYVLLKAILLCNAGLGDLSDFAQDLLTKERERLSKALLNVCMEQGSIHGPARYAAILAMVDTIEHLARDQKDLHLLRCIASPRRNPIPFLDDLML